MTTRASLGNVSVGVVIGLALGVALHQATGFNLLGAAETEIIRCDLPDGEGCDCDSSGTPATGTCTDGICVDCDTDPTAGFCCDTTTNSCLECDLTAPQTCVQEHGCQCCGSQAAYDACMVVSSEPPA